MPRTNLCENKQQKRYDYVAGMLACGIRQHNMSTADVAKRTGIPERTVSLRLLNPESTRLEDLYKLCDVAGIAIKFELLEVPE